MRAWTWLRGVVRGTALCAAIGVSSCQVTTPGSLGEDCIRQRGHALFQDQTCVRTDSYEVVSANIPVDLCIRIGLKSGILGWRILGPDGQSAHGSGDATSGKAYHIQTCVEGTPGDWQFVLDMEQASGEYEIAWYAPESVPSGATHLPRLGD